MAYQDAATWPFDAVSENFDAAQWDQDAQPPVDSGTVDSGTVTNMCANYPATDGKMNIGNPLRNYHWADKNGNEHYICELADGTNRYLYLVLASKS